MRAAVVSLLLCAIAPAADAQRANTSSAVDVFWISDCSTCTSGQKDSIFCKNAGSQSDFVSNATARVTIASKIAALGVSDGSTFCWSGTFNGLTNGNLQGGSIFNSDNVTAMLDCATTDLFYRQCVIPVQMAIILIAVGSFVVVAGVTLILFCCGCCKCCNLPGDESKWGMFNRFCPWCPCATRPEKEPDAPSWMSNPVTEEENTKSLFGKSKTLSSAPPGGEGGGGDGASSSSASSTGITMTANPQRSLAGLKKPSQKVAETSDPSTV